MSKNSSEQIRKDDDNEKRKRKKTKESSRLEDMQILDRSGFRR